MILKIAAIAVIMGLFGTTNAPVSSVETPAATVAALGGGTITMVAAPAPPSPYVKSVQFKYNGTFPGAKFRVESADGCPIYTFAGTSGLVHDNVNGVMFKAECGTTRYIDVYYNDNGTWVDYQRFHVTL